MPEQHKELFWLIRQKDDIVIFSEDENVIQPLVRSLHTNNAYMNEWSPAKAGLVLIDKNININPEEIINHLYPDSRVVVHKSNEELNIVLPESGLFFEQERDNYNVFHNNMLNPSNFKFVHPSFEKYFDKLGTNLCSFSRDYYNPYIYRSLIQIGSRIENEHLLKKLCLQVINSYPENTPDKGGCLCVLGYKKFIAKERDDEFLNKILLYCENNTNSANSHITRWIISLYFLLGIYFLEVYDNGREAIKYFERCYDVDYKKFSPLICTKQVSACGTIGYLYLSKHKKLQEAKQWFKKGIERAKDALRQDLNKVIGDDDYYIPFGFTETAELCDIASQCVFGYNNAEIYLKNSAAFDNGFNKKRFGLITYCQKLEKQLEEIRNA